MRLSCRTGQLRSRTTTRHLHGARNKVRIPLIAATTVALLFAAAALNAQNAPSQAAPRGAAAAPVNHHGVAVVDVKYILDKYSRLQQGIDNWKRERDTIAGQLQKEAESFQKQVELLKTLKPGTKEFKAKEEELAKKDSDQKVRVQLQEKDFTERRAKVFLAAYQDLTEAVKNYADRNGISLVLQFNGAPVDQNNPQSVQAEVLKLVVYQNGIDITPNILDELNRRAASSGPTSPPSAGPIARPPQGPSSPARK
jgi:Skp family chaperone for outer membrane proteins